MTQSYLFLYVESAIGFLGEKYLRVETWEGGTCAARPYIHVSCV